MTDAAKLSKYPTVDLLFPSKHIKAADLKGRKIAVTIESIDPRHKLKMKDNTEKQSPVLTLKGQTKTWVLNVTNALAIAEVFGNELANWLGKTVVIYSVKVTYGNGLVDAIRVDTIETARRANIALATKVEEVATDVNLDEAGGPEDAGIGEASPEDRIAQLERGLAKAKQTTAPAADETL